MARTLVTAIVPIWRRPQNLPIIVDRLLSMPWVAQLVLWDNNHQAPSRFTHNDSRVEVVHASKNYVTYGRFLAARRCARYSVLYTQDDDVLPASEWLEQLLASYEREPTCLHAGLSPAHYRVEVERKPWLQLGWGAMFHHSHLGVLDKYTGRYGEDELLLRKADRIFSILAGADLHRPQVADYKNLVGHGGREALYRRTDHWRLTREAVFRARALVGSGA